MYNAQNKRLAREIPANLMIPSNVRFVLCGVKRNNIEVE